MKPPVFLDSAPRETDVFYVERSSEESCPARNNTPAVLNSTQLSRAMAKETIAIYSVASPEPQIVTKGSGSNEPTIPYGFGQPTSNCATQPQWSQPAAQPIQCVGFYGRHSTKWTKQTAISGAVWRVPNLYAAKEFEYHSRLRDTAHNYTWKKNLFRVWAWRGLWGNFSHWNFWLQQIQTKIHHVKLVFYTAASTTTKEEVEHW